jgi:mono/diheme cytochrome c family protein
VKYLGAEERHAGSPYYKGQFSSGRILPSVPFVFIDSSFLGTTILVWGINILNYGDFMKKIVLLSVIVGMFGLVSCHNQASQSSQGGGASSGAGITPPADYDQSASGAAQSSSSASTPAQVNPATDKGVGPVTSLPLGPIDKAMAAKGKKLFAENCSACHKLQDEYIGPPLGDVASKTTPEFIMNMMLNTQEMLQKDPIAQHELAKYSSQMADNVNKEQARDILEYLRGSSQIKK